MSAVSATVSIHTNHKPCIGAPVARNSLRCTARRADQFGVPILHTRD
jgi:hypothetical protein